MSRREINHTMSGGGQTVEITCQTLVARPRADLRQVDGDPPIQHVEPIEFLRSQSAQERRAHDSRCSNSSQSGLLRVTKSPMIDTGLLTSLTAVIFDGQPARI